MMSKIRAAAGVLGLFLIAVGVTGSTIAQMHILRIKKALVVVDECKLEMMKANDKVGGAACNVVRDAGNRFGEDTNSVAKELANFYDENKSHIEGEK